jgi:hypothetical protein
MACVLSTSLHEFIYQIRRSGNFYSLKGNDHDASSPRNHQPLMNPAEPIGRVVEVHGPVVDVACELLPPLHRALTVTIRTKCAPSRCRAQRV